MAGVATAAISIPVIGFVATSVKEATAAIIHNEYHYLRLDKAGVQKFAEDFLSANPPTANFKLKVRGAKLFGIKASKSRVGFSISQQYLLSTDFFRNKMDESKIVKYLGLFDPYLRPCANPFSEIYYPSAK
jgi:hypothetical protein